MANRVFGSANGNNAAPTITLDASIQPGDVILLALMGNNAENMTTHPAALTLLNTTAVGTANGAAYLYRMVADANTDGLVLNWVLAATRSWSIVYGVFSGCNPSAPINGYTPGGSNASPATKSFTAPALTSTAVATLVEFMFVKGDGLTITTLSPPANWTLGRQQPGYNTYAPAGAIATRNGNPVAIGTYGSDVWTTDQNGITNIRFIVALAMSAGAEAGNPIIDIDAGTTVTLDGSASSGTNVLWELIAHTGSESPTVTITNATSKVASYRAPATFAGTTLTFRITVDGVTDTVDHTILPHKHWMKNSGAGWSPLYSTANDTTIIPYTGVLPEDWKTNASRWAWGGYGYAYPGGTITAVAAGIKAVYTNAAPYDPTGNAFMGIPTNCRAGHKYMLTVTGDGTGTGTLNVSATVGWLASSLWQVASSTNPMRVIFTASSDAAYYFGVEAQGPMNGTSGTANFTVANMSITEVTEVGKSIQLVHKVASRTVGDNSQLVWRNRTKTYDTSQLVWNTLSGSQPAPPAGWTTPIWSDYFTGTTLDTTKWWARDGKSNTPTNQKALYLASNIEVSNGTLKIHTKREDVTVSGTVYTWTSGEIQSDSRMLLPTDREWRAECRMKVGMVPDHSRGMWPCWWMRNSPSIGEIDIMEAWGTPADHSGLADSTIMTFWQSTNGDMAKMGTLLTGTTWSDWHVWAIEANPLTGDYKIYFDDVLKIHKTTADAAWLHGTEYSSAFYNRICTQVSGPYWGYADDTLVNSNATYDFEIDYVRAYTR